MQAEAEDEGWLSIWHEFTWWYPWYRVHIQININPQMHVACNPFLPGGEIGDWDGLEFFSALSEEFVEELMVDIIVIFAGYIIAKGFSLWNPIGAGITLFLKFLAQLALVSPDWNDAQRLLAASIANIILGFMSLSASIGRNFLAALFNIVTAGAMSSIYVMWNALSKAAIPINAIGRTWVDRADAIINWEIGGLCMWQYWMLTQ